MPPTTQVDGTEIIEAVVQSSPTLCAKNFGQGDLNACNDNIEPNLADDDKSCGWVVEPVCPNIPGAALVGVDGKWYDVANFIDKHPGGPIIKEFIGKDATHVFHSYGHEGVLKHRTCVGTYTMPVRSACDADFDRLKVYFKERGFFETSFTWYCLKSLVPVCLMAAVWAGVLLSDKWYVHYMSAIVLAFFWQQCGFLMHDFHHGQVFRKIRKDNIGGVIFGTICFGISSNWWRDEHIFHHSMTNTVDAERRFADPQMWEASWAQHHRFFPLFNTNQNFDEILIYIKARIQKALISVQHITFVPVVTMIGRFEIVTDSFRKERRWYEWAAWPLHWIWLSCLLSHLPTYREITIFYLIAAWVQGIFHFQLILSHYCRKHLRVDEFHKGSWYKYQILSNLNLIAPKWLDWYYGGLNFHIEHHLYPKMARNHLREAGYYVKQVCDKHGIEYDLHTFTGALWKTLVHLKTTATHYKLDPR